MARFKTVAELRDEIDDAVIRRDERRLDRLAGVFEDAGPQDHLFRANPRIRRDLGVADAEAARPETVLDFANRIANNRRRLRYNRLIDAGYSGPKIVAEGDSWFQYPLMLRDTIDVLMDRVPVFCLSAAGATLKSMLASGELVETVRERKPHYVLLSAGGNDLLDEGELLGAIANYTAGATAEQLIVSDAFNKSMRRVEGMFIELLNGVFSARANVRVLLHGYDYVVPRAIRGNYLGQRLKRDRGIDNIGLRRDVMRLIIGRYNERIAKLPKKVGGPQLTFISCLDVIGARPRADWFDEIHPRDPGFAKVAQKFLTAMS